MRCCRAASAAWVHYKLDRGIDHVLIDEAQDTSPKQWDIVAPLVAEFFAGEGAAEIRRTIFAVGDEKQSIFSFQGAAPHAFAETRQYFQKAYRTAELGFAENRNSNIRSAPAKRFRRGGQGLFAAGSVFRQRDCRRRRHAAHSALPDAAPGVVELWPLIEPAEKKRSRAGTRRSTPKVKKARACCWLKRSPGM